MPFVLPLFWWLWQAVEAVEYDNEIVRFVQNTSFEIVRFVHNTSFEIVRFVHSMSVML